MLMFVNADPMNPYGRPDPTQLKKDGFAGVRWVYRNHPDCLSYFNGCERAELLTLLVVAHESLGPHTWQDFPITEITNQYRPWAYQIGNEPDAGYNPSNSSNSVATRSASAPSSWVMAPGDYHAFHTRFAEHIRLNDPNAMVVTAGMCSGIPSWFFNLAKGDTLDYNRLGVHPYGKNPQEAESLLSEYGPYPLVSEWNRLANQIADYLNMLRRHDSWDAAFFCANDGMVSGYGLYDTNYQITPEGTALLAAMGGGVPVEPHVPPSTAPQYVLGFKKFHDAYPAEIGAARFVQFSPRDHMAVQQCEKGLLLWIEGKGMTFVAHDNHYILMND